MPAGYAHYIFGEKVLEVLDEPYRQLIERNIDLYHIGVHGPDILFYHRFYKPNEVSKLGSSIHYEEAYPFMEHSLKVIEESKDREASIAYMYGFITHFALDHSCHPYIYKMQEVLDMSHSEIESELDRKLLVDRHLDPISTCLTTHIKLNHYVSKIIAPFYDLTEENIYKTLHDLLYYLEWLRAPGKVKRGFVHGVMKIAGYYNKYGGLIINYEPNEKSMDCVLELTRRIDDNVDVAKGYIEEFLDHELNEEYHNNFE